MNAVASLHSAIFTHFRELRSKANAAIAKGQLKPSTVEENFRELSKALTSITNKPLGFWERGQEVEAFNQDTNFACVLSMGTITSLFIEPTRPSFSRCF